MLRLRICPHCQEEIYSPKAYFCHRCGAELPAPPEVEEESRYETVETPRRGVSTTPATKNRKLVVVATLVVAFVVAIAAGIGVHYFQAKPSWPSVPSLPSSPKNEAFVGDVNFAVENHPFSAKGLSEIVPADVDLYLESVDPELLLPSLVSTEDWSKFEPFLSGKLGLSVSEALSFLEDEFAIIQESTGSAFLARARDADFVEQKITETEEYEGWRAKIVEGFLVISNSPDLIRAIEEAQKKLTLNLSLTSGFVESRQKLPQTGQIFYYGKRRLKFIPDEVKGEAFVVSKKNGGILITGL